MTTLAWIWYSYFMKKIQLEMTEQDLRNIISYLEFGVGLRTKLPLKTRNLTLKIIEDLENKMSENTLDFYRDDFTFSSNNNY